MPEDRRLAAIMFTDIVGYTALMGSDEDKAFQLLRKNRDLQRPLIRKYRGEWLKEMGDGILASFHTASDAVRCAGEIQNEAKKAGLPLRIGIHEGEVVFEGSDVLGDGVNVASRLEELAEEGCINISGAVYKDIKNKAGIIAEFVEEKTLKNVDEPIKVYRVKCEEPLAEQSAENKSTTSRSKLPYYTIGVVAAIIITFLIWQFLSNNENKISSTLDTSEKTIAVIPFWNDSPDPDNAYFCSGMEEAIRINLLKIADLQIESRQSVEKYRQNPEKDMTTIGTELGVAFIVEGSVQKVENDVRVNVQLIDAKSGNHIWGETYDGDYTTKLLDFQSNTAKQIASSLNAVITPEEEKRIKKAPTTSITAYDLTIRGREYAMRYLSTLDKNDFMVSVDLLNKAISIDTNYALAYAELTHLLNNVGKFDKAFIYAKKAVELDPYNPRAYEQRAENYYWLGEADKAILDWKKAIQLAGDSLSLNEAELWLGMTNIDLKDNYREGIQYIYKVINRCKISDQLWYYWWIARTYLHVGDYEKCETILKQLMDLQIGCHGSIPFICLLAGSQNKFDYAGNTIDSLGKALGCESEYSWGLFNINFNQKNYSACQKLYKQWDIDYF